MRTMMVSLKFALLLLVFSSCCLCSETDSEREANDYLATRRVHMIDSYQPSSAPRNFLFRGNVPLTFTKLCSPRQEWDETALDNILRERAGEHNLTLPPLGQYFLLDISLVNPATPCPDLHDLRCEQRYVNSHPNTSALINWVLLGDETSPGDLDEAQRARRARTLASWQNDQLVRRIEYIRRLLTARHPVPLIIYVHCEEGVNRTHETIGAYMLRFQGIEFARVLSANVLATGRDKMLAKHYKSLQWYCAYVQYALGMSPACVWSPQ
eukprot:gnl/Trimastix_PCT/2261.p1 GENE.gnl/Trimastix_PCT/2261~~gnl/Trimastix_PCT/2261.p1  ORF type:complete len:268 (+),score=42.32 gnl/Trimastix_PCT/2261:24-827(+)